MLAVLAVLVLVFVAPVLSGLLVLTSSLIGAYMMAHFVDQAHGFQSLGRAAAVMIASFLAIAIGLSTLLLLVGGPNVGSNLTL